MININDIISVLEQNNLIINAYENITCDSYLDVHNNSNKVTNNSVFVALSGVNVNGHTYIDSAIANGAKLIILEDASFINSNANYILVANCNIALSVLAKLFYPVTMDNYFATTGTNGKTSTAQILAQILNHFDVKNMYLGTTGAWLDNKKLEETLTTPDAIDLQKLLQKAHSKGATSVSMEASSHGLQQHRLAAISFDVTAFTNLSRDHLDYHNNMEDYFLAKQKLFTERLKKGGTAVVNMDDAYGKKLINKLQSLQINHLSFAKHEDADLRVLSISADKTEQRVKFCFLNTDFDVNIPLLGEFQVYNTLCAALMFYAYYQDIKVFQDFSYLTAIDGRMQHVATLKNGATIFVDYAHSNDSLETILKQSKSHVIGKLSLVFGAGGNRDKGKRELMGQVAQRLADRVYVTDDNPRFEDAKIIRDTICAAAPKAKNIADRYEAIAMAIDELQADDMLIVAGKGHEEGQHVNGKVLPFNDAKVIKEIIAKGNL